MTPYWLRTKLYAVEATVALILVASGYFLFQEALRLGPGWGAQGPQPGFFPFVLTSMMFLGAIAVLITSYRKPDRRPFFEASQEVVDLLKVGLPVFAAIFVMRWFGLYITSGLYIGLFMLWYGRFRWYSALAGAILLPLVMWAILTYGFRIPMPMSVFYRQGILPI